MMKTNTEKKEKVKAQYSKIAEKNLVGGCCGVENSACLAEDYSTVEGYVPESDLGLGCGLPTAFANIHEGDTVLDLGSGAGNDVFIARSITGPTGKVIGIDFTEKMIEKARANAEKLGYNNVEFRQGDIESIPVNDQTADVIVSNCVLNLVPDKITAFEEIFRVLKKGGHFSISDVVVDGHLPKEIHDVAELYVGCISGAWTKENYLAELKNAGFENIKIQKEKVIELPDSILEEYIKPSAIRAFKETGTKVLSITWYAEKLVDHTPTNKAKKEEVKESCCDSTCCA